MVSEAKKKATAKCLKEKYHSMNIKITNEDMLELKQVCLSCGLQPGAAPRMFCQALAKGDDAALALLRRLAASKLDD